MLPNLVRDEKTLMFGDKQIKLKKMMVGDVVKMDKNNIVEVIQGLVSGIEVNTLSKAEMYKLFLLISEYTNGHGFQFNFKCTNEKCNLKTKFPVERYVEDINFHSVKKQSITVDEITFNIVNRFVPGKDETIGDILKSVIFDGKLYNLEKDEVETFLNDYITIEQFDKFKKQINHESAIIKFACPYCGELYIKDLLFTDFF